MDRHGERSFAQGAISVTAASALFVVSSYAVSVWLGRQLGPADYGAFGVVISVLTVLNVVQNTGIPQAVARFAAEDPTESDSILSTGLVLQAALSIGLAAPFAVASGPLARLLGDAQLAPFLQASALALLPHGLLALYLGYYNGIRAYARQAVALSVYSIAKLAATISLASVLHLLGAVLGYVVAPVLALAVALRAPARGRPFAARRVLGFAAPLVALFSILAVQQTIDLLLVKALIRGDDAAGYYTAAQNIARVPYYVLGTLGLLLAPAVAGHLRHARREEAARVIGQALRLVLVLLAPGVVLLGTTSEGLLELFYSERYVPGASALALLAIGSGATTIFSVLAGGIYGSDSIGLAIVSAAAGALVTGIVGVLLVPTLAINGASVGAAVGAVTSAGLAALVVGRRFRGWLPVMTIARVAAACLAIFLVARSVALPPLLLPVLYAALGVGYLAIIAALGEVRRSELAGLRASVLGRAARVSAPAADRAE